MNLFLWIGILVLGLAGTLIYLVMQNILFKKKLSATELSLQQLLAIEKYERKKINAILHDQLQGDLIAVKNFIYVGKQVKGELDKEDIDLKIHETLNGAIDNAKRLSHMIQPPLAETDTLDMVAKSYFGQENNLINERFEVSTKESGFDMPTDKNYELFRIIQELHHNAATHGKAKVFSLLFYQNEGFYFIEFKDNGNNFDYHNCLGELKGNGLNKIALFLKLTECELIKENVTIGNHYVLKINRAS